MSIEKVYHLVSSWSKELWHKSAFIAYTSDICRVTLYVRTVGFRASMRPITCVWIEIVFFPRKINAMKRLGSPDYHRSRSVEISTYFHMLGRTFSKVNLRRLVCTIRFKIELFDWRYLSLSSNTSSCEFHVVFHIDWSSQSTQGVFNQVFCAARLWLW